MKKQILTAITLILLILITVNTDSRAQIIAPVGNVTKASSQLVYWYDQTNIDGTFETETIISVANVNDTQGVWIHVQIFRSFDPDVESGDDGGPTDGPLDPVICDERNFVDFLTPNDVHRYDLFDPEENGQAIVKNMGEDETNLGEEVSINVDNTKGFVVITPVVSESDLSAISFQHLIGLSNVGSYTYTRINAMGRDAVDFTNGEILPDGTVLDGVTGGYVVIQPEELEFTLEAAESSTVSIIGIAFEDSYGPPGLLGYMVIPTEVTWTSFIFDFKEDPTSCGNKTLSCFDDIGLNEEDYVQGNFLLGEELLCGGTDLPGNPDDEVTGWVKIFVSGLSGLQNHFGVYAQDFTDGGDWMFTKGERTEIDPEPVPEDCSMEGDEDEDGFADCLDTDCATDESCETGAEECADGMDNDEDGDTDCEDLGCDGFAGCEFGEEMSCDDGIDNDADGAVDGDDTDCQEETTGGDGGDGGGCVVTGNSSASSSAVNFLILMLPFIGVFGIRRIRKSLDLGA